MAKWCTYLEHFSGNLTVSVYFWWYNFEVQLCFQDSNIPKNQKKQSPLIAILAMTASSFLSIAHSISLFAILPLCTHLSSTLFCPVTIEKKKRTVLLGYFSYSRSQTQWHTHKFILSCAYSPSSSPLPTVTPTPNAGGYIFILNSFSSSRESTKKKISYLLGYKRCSFWKIKS